MKLGIISSSCIKTPEACSCVHVQLEWCIAMAMWSNLRAKEAPAHQLSEVGVLQIAKPRPVPPARVGLPRQEQVPQVLLPCLVLEGSEGENRGATSQCAQPPLWSVLIIT